MTGKAIYSRKTFYAQPVHFRIGAIISDGMWYSLPKWRKLAKCSEEEINSWITEQTLLGNLDQASTGAKSFRFSLDAIKRWYEENSIEFGTQIIDFLFPPRIWDGMTEVEGFLNAPLRTISIVSLSLEDKELAYRIEQNLKGVARMREMEPNQYKIYGLDAGYIRHKVEEVAGAEAIKKIYARSEAKRREMVDFSPTFARGLMQFYSQFGKALVKPAMATIKIFLPDVEDQNSQINLWVIQAIEKFDEKSSVPFSGYLNSVLHRWPYDLPANHLGKDLSSFQRERNRAIKALNKELGEERQHSNEEIAAKMGIDMTTYLTAEEKRQIWYKTQTAATLTWEETSEEKQVSTDSASTFAMGGVDSDIVLASRISLATVQAALDSQSFEEAFFLISQIDTPELELAQLRSLSEDFVKALNKWLQESA